MIIQDYLLSFIAGGVSMLSPCVLPLLPIIFASAVSEHKYGPYAIIGGLVTSFTIFGILVSTIGFSIGLTPWLLQIVAGSLLIIFGIILIVPYLTDKFSTFMSSLMSRQHSALTQLKIDNLFGQFIIGFLLGAIWAPCIGPTLGAAISLATRGEEIGHAGMVMFFFSLGVALPLLMLSVGSQKTFMKRKEKMKKTAQWVKPTLGAVLIITGLFIVSGLEKEFQAYIFEKTPDYWIEFLYSF